MKIFAFALLLGFSAFAFANKLPGVSPAGNGPLVTSSTARAAAVSGPTQSEQVEGTILHGNAAKVQVGYRFVPDRQVVKVEKIKQHRMVGTYVCGGPDGAVSPPGCRMTIGSSVIRCNGQVAGGARCVLRSAPSVMVD